MAFGVTCPTCGKAFSITDEIYQRKVSGRVVTIKCKQCQAGIRVDASKPGVTKISAAAKEAIAEQAIETKSVGPAPPEAVAPAMAPAPRVRQATLIGGVANTMGKQAQAAAAAMAQPPAAPPTELAPGETLWAVEVGDGQDRELALTELGREIERGTIPITALAWREGMAEWLEISQVPDLAGFVRRASRPKPAAPAPKPPPAPKPATPKPAAAAPPAPKAPPPAAPQRMVEAPMSEEVPTQPKAPPGPPARAPMKSAPRMPPSPPGRASAPDFPPLGAPSPPPPPAAQPAPPPAPEAPFQLAPSAIDASPAPPLPVPPLPFAAPAPPAPAPPAPAPAAPTFATPGPVAASTDFDIPPVRSKAPLVIAGVAVVGAIVAAVVILKGSSPAPVPLSPAAETPTVATPAPADTSTPSTAAAPTPTTTATSQAAPAEGAPTSGAQATPGGGFADLFASGARDAEGTGKTAPRFDPNAAKKAVNRVLPGVVKCKETAGPRGFTTATITFEPTGKVSIVSITDPPFGGTATASCLVSVLKQATMDPFRGLPGSVSQPISLR